MKRPNHSEMWYQARARSSKLAAAANLCSLWFQHACYHLGAENATGGRSLAHWVLTSDEAQQSRRLIVPDGWSIGRTKRERPLVVRQVPHRMLQVMSQGVWVPSLLHILSSRINQDHIGHFVVIVGALFDYGRAAKGCRPTDDYADICDALLLWRMTKDGMLRNVTLQGYPSWGYHALPSAAEAAFGQLCQDWERGSGLINVTRQQESGPRNICTRNLHISAWRHDHYPRTSDIRRWRQTLLPWAPAIAPPPALAVLIIDRGPPRSMQPIEALVILVRSDYHV